MCLLNIVTFHYCVTSQGLQAAMSLSPVACPASPRSAHGDPLWYNAFLLTSLSCLSAFSGLLRVHSLPFPVEFLSLTRLQCLPWGSMPSAQQG